MGGSIGRIGAVTLGRAVGDVEASDGELLDVMARRRQALDEMSPFEFEDACRDVTLGFVTGSAK